MQRNNKIRSAKVAFVIGGGFAVLAVLLFSPSSLLPPPFSLLPLPTNVALAQNFIGPSAGAGLGQGAIGIDAVGNLSIGTSTPISNVKLLIIGTSTASSGYFSLKIIDANTGPIMLVRSDGRIIFGKTAAFGTSTVTIGLFHPGLTSALRTEGDINIGGSVNFTGTFSGDVPAINVTAGAFKSGNFAFPSSLAVGTTTNTGLPANGLFVVGNVGIGTSTPAAKLEIYHDTDVSKTLLHVKSNISGTQRDVFKIIYDEGSNFHIVKSFDSTIWQFGTAWGTGDWPARTVVIMGHKDASVPLTVLSYDTSPTRPLFEVRRDANSTNPADFMVDFTGNVGIGTTAPTKKLTVVGNQDTTGFNPGESTVGIAFSNDASQALPSRQIDITFANSLTLGATTTYAAISGIVTGSGGNGRVGALLFSTKEFVADATLTERMRITNAGNVGIGTTAPSQKLDVVGNINVSSTSAYYRGGTAGLSVTCAAGETLATTTVAGGIITGGDCVTVGGGGGIPGGSDGQVQFNNAGVFGGNANLFWDNASNRLGIGTSQPSSTLHVVGGSIQVSGGNFSGNIAASNVAAAPFGAGSFAFPGALAIGTSTTTGLPTNGLFVVGNVGIGTTVPALPLHVRAATGGDAVRLEESSGGEYITLEVDSSGNLDVETDGGVTALRIENTTGYVHIFERLVHHLDTDTYLAFDGALDQTDLYAGGIRFLTLDEVIGQDIAVFNENAVDIDFRVEGIGAVNAFFVEGSSGRVGVGTALPGYPLDVVGDINASGVYRKGGTAGLTASCPAGQVLETIVVAGGIVTGGSCVASGAGDITAVTAGTGLAGGGPSGDVTLDLDTTDIATCTNVTTHKIIWDGTSSRLTCETDQSGGGGSVTGSGVATRVAFWDGSSSISSNANLYWDNVSNRLGIGTSQPSSTLHVVGGSIQVSGGNFSGNIVASNVAAAVFGSGAFAFPGSLGIATTSQVSLPQSLSVYGGGYFSGNVGIGTASPGEELDVYNGTIWSHTAGGGDQVNLELGEFSGDPNLALYEFRTDDVGGDILEISSNRWNANVRFTRSSSGGDRNVAVISSNANTGTFFDLYGDDADNNVINRIHTEGDSYFNGGNVGIGTSSPAFKLDVAGIINAQDIYEDGVPFSSGQWTTTSTGIFYNGGNVGIGTAAPDEKLTVAGFINFEASGGTDLTNKGVRIRQSGADSAAYLVLAGTGGVRVNTDAGSGSNDAFSVWSGGASPSEVFRVQGNGRVGIGTASPAEKLHVKAVTGATRMAVQSGDDRFISLFAQHNNVIQAIIFGNTPGDSLQFATANDTSGGGFSTKLTIESDGNVGIGTAGPSEKLDINGGIVVRGIGSTDRGIRRNDNAWSLNLFGGNSETSGGTLILSGDDRFGAGLGGKAELVFGGTSISPGASGNYFSVSSRDSGALNERLRIDSSGNVGIGTTGPTSTLHISGGGSSLPPLSSGTQLVVQNNAATSDRSRIAIIAGNAAFSNLEFGDTDVVAIGKVQYNHTLNTMAFAVNNATRMTIDASGNVGIATTTPAEKLVVVGNIHAVGSITCTGSCGGDVNAANVSAGTFGAGKFAFQDGLAVGTSSAVSAPTNGLYVDGNVGIGTTSPDEKLHVSGGTVKITTPTGDQTSLFIDGGTTNRITFSTSGNAVIGITTVSNFITMTTAGQMDLNPKAGSNLNVILSGTGDFAVNTNQLYVDTSLGNVGIGTASPVEKLQIEVPSGNDVAIRIRQAGVQSWVIKNPASEFRLDLSAISSGKTVMSWLSNGNVGIGTTSSLANLHVSGTGNQTIILESTDDNANLEISSNGSAGNADSSLRLQKAGTTKWQITNDDSVGKLIISAGTLGTNDRLTIDSSGNVGIGTTGPQSLLHLEATNPIITWVNTGGTVGRKGFRIAFDNDRLTFQRASDTGVFEANYMAIDQNTGNVGIGDASPLALLTVGSGDLFRVDTSGDLNRIRNIAYAWPVSQGGASTILTNDGAGNLSWGTAGGGGTVTSVGSGTGLTGGPITGSGSLSVVYGSSAGNSAQGNVTLTGATAGNGLTGGGGAIAVGAGGTFTTLNVGAGSNITVAADTVGVVASPSFTGLTVDGGTNSTQTILSDDAGVSTLNVRGPSQGSGMVFVGQSTTHGGGIAYDGDGTPAMVGATDHIAIFRRSAGVDTAVLEWVHNNSQAEFRGNIDLNGNNLVGGGTLTATTLSGSLAWSNLTSFPAGCATGSAVRVIGTTLTCVTVGAGTITGVTAGNQLTGGGTSGTVTLNVSEGAGSGLDADLLDGQNLTSASTVSTVVGRDGSGDINARLFRSEYDPTNATINFIMTQVDTVSNNYIRPSTPAQLISALNLSTGAHSGGTVTSVGSGNGLTGGPITGSGTLNVGAGTGITVSANAVAINTGAALTWTALQTFNGGITATGLQFVNAVGAHINTDGALYRFGGQVYLTVDDNMFWRDSVGGDAMHLQTDTRTLTIGGGSGKLNVGTIDPIYTIGGKRYATYLPAMTGVKEETTGTLILRSPTSEDEDCNNSYEVGLRKHCAVINFNDAEVGSDLWLFAKTIDLKKHFDDMVVLLTPAFDGKVWYEKDVAALTITIFAIPHTLNPSGLEVSYRLTAPRFDAAEWPNSLPADSTNAGFILD